MPTKSVQLVPPFLARTSKYLVEPGYGRNDLIEIISGVRSLTILQSANIEYLPSARPVYSTALE